MSFEEGKSITNMKYIKENKISIKEVGKILTDTFNRQIFELGFVHSDPHPGNLFIRKEKINGKEKTKLILLDHGLYRILDDSFRLNYCLLWKGIITQNKNYIRESCKNLNIKQIELFISILTSNTYNEIINQSKKYASNRHIGIQSKIKITKKLKKKKID
jgi:aarF domain-containing kinase